MIKTNNNIPHLVVLFSLFFMGFSLLAQETKVVVIDASLGERMPYAHIRFTSLTSDKTEFQLTNENGEAIIPTDVDLGSPIAIHVSFVGFDPVEDTIIAGQTTKIKLHESAEMLTQVVVTGQFSASSPEKAVHKISLISKDKIEALNAVSLDQVLARELNMQISQDGVLGSSISIQGLSGENVKILVDGVPMIGRLNGNIDLSQINLNDVERIEVVEGPLSVSYGSNALAGTINIITKKDSKKPFSANAKTYFENIGTANVDGSVNLSKGKYFGGVNITRNFFNGWNIGDPVWGQPEPKADSSRSKLWNPRTQLLGGLKLGRKLKKGTLLYNLNAFDETILNRGLPRAPYGEYAFDDEYLTNRFDNSLTLDLNLDSLKNFQLIGAFNMYRRERKSYITDLTGVTSVENPEPGVNDTTSTRLFMLRPTFSAQPKNKSWRYQVGLDINNETATGERILDDQQTIGDYAAFTSFEFVPGTKWTIRPGIRFAYNTKYGAPVVPSFNVKYLPRPGMAIRGSIARGFRAPSVKELYLDFVDINHDIHGNPDLEAETALHSSLNFSYARLHGTKMYKMKIGLFYNQIQNKISLAQSTGTLYEYANVDEAISLGTNIEFQTTIEHFKGNIGFSYTGTQNTISAAEVKPDFAFYPQVTTTLSYDFKKSKTNVSFFLKYNGELPQFIVNDDQQVEQSFLGSYTLMDLTASRKFWKDHFIVGAGIKNMLDVTNVSTGTSGGAHGGSNGTRPIAPGRVYFLKLGVQF